MGNGTTKGDKTRPPVIGCASFQCGCLVSLSLGYKKNKIKRPINHRDKEKAGTEEDAQEDAQDEAQEEAQEVEEEEQKEEVLEETPNWMITLAKLSNLTHSSPMPTVQLIKRSTVISSDTKSNGANNSQSIPPSLKWTERGQRFPLDPTPPLLPLLSPPREKQKQKSPPKYSNNYKQFSSYHKRETEKDARETNVDTRLKVAISHIETNHSDMKFQTELPVTSNEITMAPVRSAAFNTWRLMLKLDNEWDTTDSQ